MLIRKKTELHLFPEKHMFGKSQICKNRSLKKPFLRLEKCPPDFGMTVDEAVKKTKIPSTR